MSATARPDRRALTPRVATATLFFINGLLIAAWVLHIPDVRDRLGLSDAQLGAALLAIAAGSLTTMPLTGRWAERRGSGLLARLGGLGMALSLLLPFLAPNLWTLWLALALFGASNGLMDVAMNAHGAAIERRLGVPLMSGLHAWWSLGNVAGALGGTVLGLLGAGLWPQVLGATLLALGGVTWAGLHLLPRQLSEAPVTPDAAPETPGRWSPVILLAGLACFLGMLSEGASADWSGLYYRDELGVQGTLSSLGYAALVLAMLLGRLYGDGWRTRLGDARLVGVGAALATLGILLALLSVQAWSATLGYLLAGLGLANIVPVIFGAAGRRVGARGIARVATLGYLGFLVGPPLIGAVSHAAGLRWGLGVTALSLGLVGLLSRQIIRD